MFEEGQKDKLTNQKLKTITLKKPVTSPLENFRPKPKLRPNFQETEEDNRFLDGFVGSKKQKFEGFLTYRKRLSRLAIVQGFYFYEQFKQFNEFECSFAEEVNEVYRIIIYFYKRMFFQQKYGTNKKNKKLDERFVRSMISNFISHSARVDDYIKKRLGKKWRISKLTTVVRCGFRAAICEALFGKKISHKIISSEYTTLIALSIFEEKEIAFFNATLDSILKEIKKEHA